MKVIEYVEVNSGAMALMSQEDGTLVLRFRFFGTTLDLNQKQLTKLYKALKKHLDVEIEGS